MAGTFSAEDISGPEEQQVVYDAIEAAIAAASAVGAAAQVTASAALTPTGSGASLTGVLKDASAFATSAQGLLADNAQPKSGNSFTVATVPLASSNVGRVIYVTDGAAGSAGAAISDGSAWKVIAIGATAATS